MGGLDLQMDDDDGGPRRGKTKASVDIPDDLEQWLQARVQERRFKDRTHAILASLEAAKKRWEKEEKGDDDGSNGAP